MADGDTLLYRLFVPVGYDPTGKFPLVVFLHGAGGSGTDNLAQLTDQEAPFVFVQPENQARWPVFMLAPQCPDMWTDFFASDPSGKGAQPPAPSWPIVSLMAVIDQLLTEYPGIDPDRLYITGLSYGGFGTWDAGVRYPWRWRAMVPVCGGYDETKIAPLVDMPVWAFHAADDDSVPVERSRDVIAALRALGGKPKYTEYPAEAHYGHASWNPAYNDPQLLPWMFDEVPKMQAVGGPGGCACAAAPGGIGIGWKVAWTHFIGAWLVLCALGSRPRPP
jgi:predicted peptidase